MDKAVEDLRRQVDEVDAEILLALNRRAGLVEKIGEAKSSTGSPIYQPAREAQVVARAVAGNAGPLNGASIAAIFGQIMVACRSLEKVLKVAYLGPEHTYTHQAARNVFGSGAEYLGAPLIAEVFAKTERGEVEFGVVPIENSTAGTVGDTLDRFVESTARIVGETVLPISHNLLSRSALPAIKVVYSHPQALAQCQGWLTLNLPWADRLEVASTAAAAARAAAEEGAGAIGLPAGGEAHGLRVVAADIQDFTANATRFFVIGRASNQPSGHDRTAVLFAVIDRVGALHDILGILRNRQINLCNIQTRPARGRAEAKSGDYVFFVEFWGHHDDAAVADAIREMRGLCSLVKVVGSWPARYAED